MLEVLFGKSWPQADPEGVLHYLVGHRQLARHSVLLVLHVRLASQVACEQQPRTDLLRIQVT
ncbi:hypothetical protein D3C78_1208110 [compost metagenome]